MQNWMILPKNRTLERRRGDLIAFKFMALVVLHLGRRQKEKRSPFREWI